MGDRPEQAWHELLGPDHALIPADRGYVVEYLGDLARPQTWEAPYPVARLARLQKYAFPNHPATCVQPVSYLVPDDMSAARAWIEVCRRHGATPTLQARIRRMGGTP